MPVPGLHLIRYLEPVHPASISKPSSASDHVTCTVLFSSCKSSLPPFLVVRAHSEYCLCRQKAICTLSDYNIQNFAWCFVFTEDGDGHDAEVRLHICNSVPRFATLQSDCVLPIRPDGSKLVLCFSDSSHRFRLACVQQCHAPPFGDQTAKGVLIRKVY